MILEIEYYKGDTLLSGKQTSSVSVLRKQLSETEKLCDQAEDNFTELLCRLYGWTVIQTSIQPDYIYDRDIKKVTKIKI